MNLDAMFGCCCVYVNVLRHVLNDVRIMRTTSERSNNRTFERFRFSSGCCSKTVSVQKHWAVATQNLNIIVLFDNLLL